MRLLFACGISLALGLLAPAAAAHVRSESFSTWRLHGEELSVVFSVSAREATRLETSLADHLGQTLGARAGGQPCAAISEPTPLLAREGHLRVELRWRCGADRPLTLEVSSFLAPVPSHVHFARVAADDGPVIELLFSERAQTREALPRGGAKPVGESFAGYVALGIEHIALGADHLAFLIALLLFATRTREVAVLVTGFTLGHSLTLALAALGVARPEPALVEATIGFTIALVAAENISSASADGPRISSGVALVLAALAGVALFVERGPPALLLFGLALFTACRGQLTATPDSARRLRPALAVVFGGVHGFGFAGVLLELGLPRERILAALLGFNLGVEFGQIAFVVGVAILALLARRLVSDRTAPFARDAAAALVCGLGVYWFVGRGYALLAP